MNTTLTTVLYTSKTLSNGTHPLMLRLTKNRRIKYISLHISLDAKFWDFDKGRPKRNCPEKERINALIETKTKELQEQIVDFKTSDKEYMLSTLIEKASRKVVRQTVGDYLNDYIDRLLAVNRIGNAKTFANWAKVTPRQNAFIQRILNSSCHVICTMRSKQDYVLSDKNGKMVPEKVGLKAVQRDNVDYEFTAVLDIAMNHKATTSKDRTGLFTGHPEFTITPAVGQAILKWCNMTQTAQSNPSTQNLHSHASSLSA